MKNSLVSTPLSILVFFASLFIGCSKSDAPVVCPQGFTGGSCVVQQLPTIITLKGVVVNAFPTANEKGTPYDLSSAPDLVVGIFDNAGTKLWESELKTDAKGEVTFTRGLPLYIKNIADLKSYKIGLYDDDGALGIESIESTTFALYSATNKFTPNLVVNCSTCRVKFTLSLEYAW